MPLFKLLSLYYTHTLSSSCSSHSAVVPICTSQTASSVLESVTGISDWEFLKPNKDLSSSLPATSTSDVNTTKGGTNGKKVPKNPTLDDFDGEIAVFQVQYTYLCNRLHIVIYQSD